MKKKVHEKINLALAECFCRHHLKLRAISVLREATFLVYNYEYRATQFQMQTFKIPDVIGCHSNSLDTPTWHICQNWITYMMATP